MSSGGVPAMGVGATLAALGFGRNHRHNPPDPAPPRTTKRPANDLSVHPQTKKPHQSLPEQKTPLMALNEKFPNLQQLLKWEDGMGQDKKPYFRCYAELNGVVFQGEGQNKKLAKQTMAQHALDQLLPSHELAQPQEPSLHLAPADIPGPSRDDTNVIPSSQDTTADSILVEKCPDKSPVSMLHDCAARAGLPVVWEVGTVDGRPPAPQSQFVAVATVGSREIRGGVGGSKKDAKINAACSALSQLFNLSLEASWYLKSAPIQWKNVAKAPGQKPPPLLLHELCQQQGSPHYKLEYELVQEKTVGQAKTKLFSVKVRVGWKEFLGTGSSKKEAKSQAAKEALRQVFQVDSPKPSVALQTKSAVDPLADQVMTLVKKRHLELCSEHFLAPSAHLAGFVLSIGPNGGDCYVVSLGVGSRAVGAPLRRDGQSLFDCHSIVLCRRGLLLFLYQQLMMLLDPERAAQSIFQPCPDGGYRLKQDYKFHLYSSRMPVGACELLCDGDLRCYRSDGITTQSLKTLQAATPDGGLERVMCVSDKLLKWTMLGVQGALLAQYIQPIHIHSFVIGDTQTNRQTVSRGIWGRLSTARELPQPVVSRVSRPEQIGDRPCPGMSWTSAAPGLESLDQETGRELSGRPSRLCKQGLMEQFDKIHGRLRTIHKRYVWENKPKSYGEAKREALVYQRAKQEFVSQCRVDGLGSWIQKPLELEQFQLLC